MKSPIKTPDLISETFPKKQESLGYLLAQTAFLKQRITNMALVDLDITYMQFVILAATKELAKTHSIVNQQLISKERRIDKVMVSNVVKTLIAKKLIIREKHPVDKRAYSLRLSPEGEKKGEKGKEIAYKVDTVFFSCIDAHQLESTLKCLLQVNGSNHN